jgi:hypothetical protein
VLIARSKFKRIFEDFSLLHATQALVVGEVHNELRFTFTD